MTVGASMAAETTGTEPVEVTADSETKEVTAETTGTETVEVTADSETEEMTEGRASSAVSVPMADLTNEAMTGPDSIAPIRDAETADKAPKTGPSTPTTGPALRARTPTSPSEMPAIDAKPLGPAGGVVGNDRTVDEAVDNDRTGGEGMTDAHPPQTTVGLPTIKTVSDEQKASAPGTPTTNPPEISENHVNLNAAAMTEECP